MVVRLKCVGAGVDALEAPNEGGLDIDDRTVKLALANRFAPKPFDRQVGDLWPFVEVRELNRDGSFQLDTNGVLVSRSGRPVQWDGGRGLIDPDAGGLKVDAAGAITGTTLEVSGGYRL